MSLLKSTRYAPDIYKNLNGILLLYKPPDITTREQSRFLRAHISDTLNQYEPRPLDKRLLIEGNFDEEKRVVEVPNLADHPLVAGPRYNPWELTMTCAPTTLSRRCSGINVLLIGDAARRYYVPMKRANLTSIYHISGCFGYITDSFFHDGKIIDKSNYKHIRSGRFDSVLSKIETSQHQRLFDSANVQLDSQEAYELAKAWPSRPPKMARWPVIYRIRCLHMKLPDFKIEVTVGNENETFLAQLPQDIGLMLKSGAYTKSIRRVKLGPFDVEDSLTDKEWDMRSIMNHLSVQSQQHSDLIELLRAHRKAMPIRTEHNLDFRTENKY